MELSPMIRSLFRGLLDLKLQGSLLWPARNIVALVLFFSLIYSSTNYGEEYNSKTLDKALQEFSYLPVLYKGRYRPAEAYARLGLDDSKSTSSLFTFLQLHFQDPELSVQKNYEALILTLKQRGQKGKELFSSLESQYPLDKLLRESGNSFRMLPLRHQDGDWVSLHALNLKLWDTSSGQLVPIRNFTAFSNADFDQLRLAYFELESAFLQIPLDMSSISSRVQSFSQAYQKAYQQLQAQPYQIAHQKALYYPSTTLLYWEAFYYRYPLFDICLGAYFISLLGFAFAYCYPRPFVRRMSLWFLAGATLLHTLYLGFRCYLLQRPPVSNMYETVLYVPWIAMMTSWLLGYRYNSYFILAVANFICLILLSMLKITGLSGGLDNVQAVLNSHYWLVIHVLMVVGSYGLFCLSGIIGHVYLVSYCLHPGRNLFRDTAATVIRQSIYIGLVLLIAGTLLGGVWAAESWGRFWDWDPKEAWAFISICIYLFFVHAYMFKKIGDFGLAVGSIAGLQAISFTWYGVNYILGTGLHSYGFGTGGEYYYYLYLVLETLFILYVLGYNKRHLHENPD